MKKKILLGSGLSAGLASATAIGGVLFGATDALIKTNMIAGYLGLLAVSLFFVGLAFPKDVQ